MIIEKNGFEHQTGTELRRHFLQCRRPTSVMMDRCIRDRLDAASDVRLGLCSHHRLLQPPLFGSVSFDSKPSPCLSMNEARKAKLMIKEKVAMLPGGKERAGH
jgi:hypothetical protein